MDPGVERAVTEEATGVHRVHITADGDHVMTGLDHAPILHVDIK